MVVYKCDNCFKDFNHKGNYLHHINRKNKCKQIQSNIPQLGSIIPKTGYNCEYCNNEYKQKCHLMRHLKTCKEKRVMKKKWITFIKIQKYNNKYMKKK